MSNIVCTIVFLIIKVANKLGSHLANLMYPLFIKGALIYHHVIFNPSKTSFIGKTKINIGKNAKVILGDGFSCLSGIDNSIDMTGGSKINVKDGATLIIGSNTGITNTIIQCHDKIIIGNKVKIGAGTMIFDTDFHSLDWRDRNDGSDIEKRKKSPVIIEDLAFIGAHCIILKGVTIGEKSIIGAGSVVSRNVPSGEIWAGNPAKFIKIIK